MSGTHWAAIIGTVGGVIGALGGVGGPVIALVARRDSRDSAKASRDSADEAAKVRQIEADRQHEDLKPKAPAKIEAKLRNGTLWGSITVEGHDYRFAAVGIYTTGGEHQLEVSGLLRDSQPHDFPIEPWPHGSVDPKTSHIRFRFWPPAEDDDATSWSCRCGRLSGEDTGKEGHWEWLVPVVYVDPTNNVW